MSLSSLYVACSSRAGKTVDLIAVRVKQYWCFCSKNISLRSKMKTGRLTSPYNISERRVYIDT